MAWCWMLRRQYKSDTLVRMAAALLCLELALAIGRGGEVRDGIVPMAAAAGAGSGSERLLALSQPDPISRPPIHPSNRVVDDISWQHE